MRVSSRRNPYPIVENCLSIEIAACHLVLIVFVCCSTASLDPSIDLFFFKLPESAYSMSGHAVPVYPAVHGVTADTEILAYLVY
jgi:hypothetical protein